MWATVEERLVDDFRAQADVRAEAHRLEDLLRSGEITATAAARRLLDLRGR